MEGLDARQGGAGTEQAPGGREVDEPRQPLGGAGAGDDAEADVRLAEEGGDPLASHAGRAGVGDLAARPEGLSVQRADHGLAQRLDPAEDGVCIGVADPLLLDLPGEVPRDAVLARPIDWVSVKGKKEAVLIYELLGLHKDATPAAQELVAHYTQGLTCYRSQDWTRAIACFEQVLQLRIDDQPARQMIARCRGCQETPPDQTWDGVHHFCTK